MTPDLSWSALVPSLDALASATTTCEIQAALAAPLSRLNARLLVTAARSRRDGALKLEVELDLLSPALGARIVKAMAGAILEASAGRVAPFRLNEPRDQDARLRHILAEIEAPDALLLPRFENRTRSVSLLAGEALRLQDRSVLISTRILIEAAVSRREALDQPSGRSDELLTRRQRECLEGALRGRNSIQIGAALRLRPRTVDAYIAAAARRLGVGNRVAAVALALQLGLIGAV